MIRHPQYALIPAQPVVVVIVVVHRLCHPSVGGFMADLAGRRSVLFPKIQQEAGKKNQRYEIFGEESSLCEVLVW